MKDRATTEREAFQFEVTPGLQCCLLCRRVLTDRALHDALEAPALAAFGAEHPEWALTGETCEPCISQYRQLLRERQTRGKFGSEARNRRMWPAFMNKLFGRAGQNVSYAQLH